VTLCHSGYEHMAHGCCDIVERLKKRREELANEEKGQLDEELQKILGESNEV